MKLRTRLTVIGGGVMAALAAAVPAFASGPTMPTLPINSYGDTLLTAITNVLGQVWPYAAVFTGVGLAVIAVKSWIGRRNATHAVR